MATVEYIQKGAQEGTQKSPQGDSQEDSQESTKSRLIHAATLLFAEKGYEGTTVKNIADQARVNISLISYYFNGKEGLYRACLEKFGKARLTSTERILRNPQTLEEFKVRLQLFIEEFFETHLQEPELVRIITRECDLQGHCTSIAGDIFRDIFLKNYQNVVQFFSTAQKKGFLRQDVNLNITCGLLFGGLIHFIQKDRINEIYFGSTLVNKDYRSEVVRQVISFCLIGCVKLKSDPDRSAHAESIF